jgi:deoxyadenosine/deoxycytidine kinase
MLRRIVSIEGNIGAGKTTLVQHLVRSVPHCVALHEPVTTNPYLERFYAEPHRWALPTQLWLLKQRFRTYQAALKTLSGGEPQLVVLDRSVWSDWVFAKQAHVDGFISDAQFDWYLRLRGRIAERCSVAQLAVVWLDVSPAECLHRVHHVRKRPYEQAISLAYLEGLDRHYADFFADMHTRRGVPLLRFDWNQYGDRDHVARAIQSL